MNAFGRRCVRGAARFLVRLALALHPRPFREQFGRAVLAAVDADLAEAPTMLSALRIGLVASLDGLASLRLLRSLDSHLRSADAPQESAMTRWIRDAFADAAYGLRGFRRELPFSLGVVATLALGIGVNAAMFGVADRLLLSGPADVRDIGTLRRLQIAWQPVGSAEQIGGAFAYAAYLALSRNTSGLDGMAAYNVYPNGIVLGRGPDARQINLGRATATLFPLLGVSPALGRFYTAVEDDTVAPASVVVIGYALWQQEFGGRPDVLGRSIVLGNSTYSIVGVAPSGFTGPDLIPVDVWFPESLLGPTVVRPNWTQSWNSRWLKLVVRLKPGVSTTEVSRQATLAFRNAYPGRNQALRAATISAESVLTDGDGLVSMESRVSTWLSAVAAIVLLVVCANVANLLLVRGLRRRREMAVRLALGASRGRLARLLVMETLTLSVAGAAVSLGVAYGLGIVIRRWLIPHIEWPHGPVDFHILALALTIAVLTGIVLGLVPVWRTDLTTGAALKTGVREGGGRTGRIRAALTVLQAALCALLLVGSGLFVRSLDRVRGLDLGLEPNRVLWFTVRRAAIPSTADAATKDKEQQRRAAFDRLTLERLKARPDIDAVSLSVGLAFWSAFGQDIHVPGREAIPNLKGGGPYVSAVSADYFRTVGTPILRGRAFTSADRAGSAPVTIVNQTMAETLWPGQEALGKCFVIEDGPGCADVVGVAANSRRFKLEENAALSFYIPLGQEKGIGGTTLLVRPRGSAAAVSAAVRQDLLGHDPSITFVDAQSLQDLVEPQFRPWELGASMFSLMGLLALVVAAVGLYSVMVYLVASRRHEIGVRMALGASPAAVGALIVRSGLVLAGAGIVVGLGLAVVAGHWVEPLLFRTSPRDPAVYGAVAAALVCMAIVATCVPAARAKRVNPVESMRDE